MKDDEIAALLPAELRARARCLAGELAWTPEDAVEVASRLAAEGYAVSGAELWQEVDGHPRWIATSGYDSRQGPEGADAAPWCVERAVEIIRRFAVHPGALFNFT